MYKLRKKNFTGYQENAQDWTKLTHFNSINSINKYGTLKKDGNVFIATKKNCNTKEAAIAQAILSEYQPNNVEDMQEAFKDIFGPMFEAMLQGEIVSHRAMKTMITKPRIPPIAEMAIRIKLSNPLTGILRLMFHEIGKNHLRKCSMKSDVHNQCNWIRQFPFS